MTGLIADEVADVGDDPGRAGFDELVVVELVEVFGDDGQLLCDHHEQRLERAARGFGGELVEAAPAASGGSGGMSGLQVAAQLGLLLRR